MEYVKNSIDERAKHKEEYNSWVNERQMQTTEDKVDSSKALDASLVDTEKPMAEVQTTAEINIFATGQRHTEQPKFNNEGKVYENAEQCHDTCPLPATLTNNQTIELSNQTLESENIRLKKTVAQFQKDFLIMEAHCGNRLYNHVETNQFAFKSERPGFSKQRFASQVNVNNDLSKPVTTHYLPKDRESSIAKPHHMIAPGSSWYSSNDMVPKHYLEEAKKKTQESSRNS
ncbi:hypothetical protein Tco_0756236 [Tanacetum coccineum]